MLSYVAILEADYKKMNNNNINDVDKKLIDSSRRYRHLASRPEMAGVPRFLNDVIVFSRAFYEHLRCLQAMLRAIETARLTLKPTRCRFAYAELKFLGHVVSNEGVCPDPEKTRVVEEFSPASDKKAVRRFHGLCAYSKRFVQDIAGLSAPLTHLTKETVKFEWTKEEKRSFDELKRRLQTPPILGYL